MRARPRRSCSAPPPCWRSRTRSTTRCCSPAPASRSPSTRSPLRSRSSRACAAVVQFRLAAAGRPRRDRVHVRRARGRATAAATRTTSSTRATTANDVTGVLALAAGVVLVGLAAWIPFRHRGEGAASPVRRWAIRVAWSAGGPARRGLRLHAGRHGDRRHPLAAPRGRQPARRRIRDGQLHGLRRRRPRGLVPPVAQRRGRADDLGRRRRHPQHDPPRQDARPPRLRRAALRPARHRQQRGHDQLLRLGPGEGRRRGARLPRHARRRRAGRVGALGLSTGADMAIDIAARRDDVKAVVADGTAAIGYEDIKEYTDDPLTRVPMWVHVQDASRSSRAAPGPRRRSPTRSPAATRRTCSSPPARPRRSGASSTTRPAAPAPSSGTCRRRATPRRCKQYPEAYEQRVVSFLDANLRAAP